MGLYLIAESWFSSFLSQATYIAYGALGLGFVIFVHELGHFLVAKACGVKCEKFYLGFDPYGLRLFRFQWGETEYGIGVIPFGGYVKMLGQDDNPAKAQAERERSMIPSTAEAGGEQTEPAANKPTYVLDPRSYMAKSVPQRMAIISAGVIMNVIFAFIMATIAYRLGVTETPCQLSQIIPGEAAWQADLQPGDKIVKINDVESPMGLPLRYRDLMQAVMFSDLQKGIKFTIQRDGVEKEFDVTLKPDATQISSRLKPTIGVVPARSTKMGKVVADAGAAADASKGFQEGDTVVEVNGTPVHDYTGVLAQMARHASEPLEFVVDRKEQDKPSERVKVTVQPRHRRTLGLVMNVGKITAVQKHSPAEEAGLQAGDFIQKIDGSEWDELDPITLDERLRGRAGEKISITVSRENESGKNESLEKTVTLRDPAYFEEPAMAGNPTSAPTMGIAYRVLNVVHRTEPESPARKATLLKDGKEAPSPQIAPEDKIVKAEIVAGSDAERKFLERADYASFEFSDEKPNWPFFDNVLQTISPQAKVKLTLSDGRTVELQPTDAPDSYLADRQLPILYLSMTTKAEDWGQAMALGARETKEGLLQVYSFLRRIGTQISVKGMAGPLSIFNMAGSSAEQGISTLLIFLTMLSTNLAVINFLPIPVLDGGHMVFLAYEGIFRRPVNERIRDSVTFAGLMFILGLMCFVIYLDINRLARGGA